ncbi:hypothetical protein BD414DRAFT_510950 [Trametes punicea]|nr:hypothetical protein BD414DRAFT_510950 [Trametes punicea]
MELTADFSTLLSLCTFALVTSMYLRLWLRETREEHPPLQGRIDSEDVVVSGRPALLVSERAESALHKRQRALQGDTRSILSHSASGSSSRVARPHTEDAMDVDNAPPRPRSSTPVPTDSSQRARLAFQTVTLQSVPEEEGPSSIPQALWGARAPAASSSTSMASLDSVEAHLFPPVVSSEVGPPAPTYATQAKASVATTSRAVSSKALTRSSPTPSLASSLTTPPASPIITPTSSPRTHPSVATTRFEDSDSEGEYLFKRRTKARRSTGGSEVTAFFLSEDQELLSAPPGSKECQKLRVGDVFCHTALSFKPARRQLWLRDTDEDGNQYWKPVSQGYKRAHDGKRLILTPTQKEPSWVGKERARAVQREAAKQGTF